MSKLPRLSGQKCAKALKMDALLKRDISEITKRIRNKYQPEKIILFGSAVYGEVKPGSDIDFFIIKDSDKPMHKRIVDIFRLLRGVKREYPLDFVVFTPDEWQDRLGLGDFLVKNIFEEGKVLYE